MNEEEKRIAMNSLMWLWFSIEDGKRLKLDPLNNLNHMNIIEMTMTDKQYTAYANHLEQQFPYGRTIRSKSASAKQRVDACLKTFEVWVNK